MGCGASRLDSNHEGVPPRLRPLLRQRFEEMRARRGHSNYASAPKPDNIDNNSVSSSQRSVSKHDHSSNHHNHNHTHNHNHDQYEGVQDCPKSPQIDNHGDEDEVKSRPVMPNDNEGNLGRKSEKANKGSFEVDGEEDGRTLERDNSPSFRVYCSDSSFENIPELFDAADSEESEENLGLQSISTNDESVSSNKPSVKNLNKKGKRGRRLKQMMAKGGKHKFHMHAFHHNIVHRSSENPCEQ